MSRAINPLVAMSMREIAEELDLNIKTVEGALKSGLSKLRGNPGLFAEVVGLSMMRQSLYGEHRIMRDAARRRR